MTIVYRIDDDWDRTVYMCESRYKVFEKLNELTSQDDADYFVYECTLKEDGTFIKKEIKPCC